jgi:recombination protein RecR
MARSEHSEPVSRLIDELTRLPGIGRRSAERIAFHVLKTPAEEALRLSRAIADVKDRVRHCSICSNLSEVDPCRICADPGRDASTVLVVEQPKDLLSLEQTGSYRGVYHVLLGRLDPLAGIGPEQVTVQQLLHRVAEPAANCRAARIGEVILGLNPDMEGDTTALHLAEELGRRGVKVTRLARGLPAGSQLEYASRAVLVDALLGRQTMTGHTG